MQIPIRPKLSDTPLYLIELQGSLQLNVVSSELDESIRLGELSNDDIPKLYIGNHILEGTSVNLKKPLLICKKTMDGLNVINIIKTKLLFRTRPEHIVQQRGILSLK